MNTNTYEIGWMLMNCLIFGPAIVLRDFCNLK